MTQFFLFQKECQDLPRKYVFHLCAFPVYHRFMKKNWIFKTPFHFNQPNNEIFPHAYFLPKKDASAQQSAQEIIKELGE